MKYTMVTAYFDGAEQIFTAKHFGKKAMTKAAFEKAIIKDGYQPGFVLVTE